MVMPGNTHPGSLIRSAGLSHRLRILELVHVALKLLDVLLEFPVLA
jgi:hypothetical protein